MNLYKDLPAFADIEEFHVNVVVETPTGSQNKFDYDPDAGAFFLDRPIHSALRYPCDYGFIPRTLANDGDPVDAVLLIPEPTFPGCVVKARIVAVMDMKDEDGQDEKIICVPAADPRGKHIRDVDDLPEQLRRELEHFFIHIKDLEKAKWAEVSGFRARSAALDVVRQGISNGDNTRQQ